MKGRRFKYENLPQSIKEKIESIHFVDEEEMSDEDVIGEGYTNYGWCMYGEEGNHYFTFTSRQDLIDEMDCFAWSQKDYEDNKWDYLSYDFESMSINELEKEHTEASKRFNEFASRYINYNDAYAKADAEAWYKLCKYLYNLLGKKYEERSKM